MTKQQVIEEYGNYELVFKYYYKYTFYFEYKDDNITISGSRGGCSDDIYRFEVDNNMKVLVKKFEDVLNDITIEDNGKEIFSWNDWD